MVLSSGFHPLVFLLACPFAVFSNSIEEDFAVFSNSIEEDVLLQSRNHQLMDGKAVPHLNEAEAEEARHCQDKSMALACAEKDYKDRLLLEMSKVDADSNGKLNSAEWAQFGLHHGFSSQPSLLEAMNEEHALTEKVDEFAQAMIEAHDKFYNNSCGQFPLLPSKSRSSALSQCVQFRESVLSPEPDVDGVLEKVEENQEVTESQQDLLQTNVDDGSEASSNYSKLALAGSRLTRAEKIAAKNTAWSAVAKSFATLLAADYCWRDVWIRPTHAPWCPSDRYQGSSGLDSGLCYKHCRSGYRRVGDTCWEDCPGNFNDLGVYCQREHMECGPFGFFSWGCTPRFEVKDKGVIHSPGCSMLNQNCNRCRSGYYKYGASCYKNKKPGYHCNDGELTCTRGCHDPLGTGCVGGCASDDVACVLHGYQLAQGLTDAVISTAVLALSFGSAPTAVLAQQTTKNAVKKQAQLNAKRLAMRVSKGSFDKLVKKYRKKIIKDAIIDNMKNKVVERGILTAMEAYAESEADALTRVYEQRMKKNAEGDPSIIIQKIDPTGIAKAIDESTGDEIGDANKQAANWMEVIGFFDPTGWVSAVAGFIKESHCESTEAKMLAHLKGKVSPEAFDKIEIPFEVLPGKDVDPGCPKGLADATISQCKEYAAKNGFKAFGRVRSSGLCCFKAGSISDLIKRLVDDRFVDLYKFGRDPFEVLPGKDVDPGCPNRLAGATVLECKEHAKTLGFEVFGRVRSNGECCFKAGSVDDLVKRMFTDKNVDLYKYK